MKLLIALIFLLILSASYAESKDIEHWAKENQELLRFNSSFLSVVNLKYAEKKKEIDSIISVANKNILEDPNNPVPYFIRGMASRKTITLNNKTIWKGISRDKYFSHPDFLALTKSAYSDYRKAIELDKSVDATMHLTQDMLIAMTSDVLLPPDVAELIMRRELEIGEERGDHYYQNTYIAMYESYLQRKNFEEARRILGEMAQKLPSMSDRISNMRKKIDRIEAHEASIAKQKIDHQKVLTPKTSPKPKQAKPKDGNKLVDKVKEKDNSSDYWLLLVLVVALLCFIVLIVYAIKTRK